MYISNDSHSFFLCCTSDLVLPFQDILCHILKSYGPLWQYVIVIAHSRWKEIVKDTMPLQSWKSLAKIIDKHQLHYAVSRVDVHILNGFPHLFDLFNVTPLFKPCKADTFLAALHYVAEVKPLSRPLMA